MQFYPAYRFFLFQKSVCSRCPVQFCLAFRTRISRRSRQNSCLVCFESDVPLLHDFVQYGSRCLVAGMMLWNVPEKDNTKLHYRAGWHSGNNLSWDIVVTEIRCCFPQSLQTNTVTVPRLRHADSFQILCETIRSALHLYCDLLTAWIQLAWDRNQCEHGTEPSGYVKCGTFLEWLGN
jgi:hypothetical protein